MDIDGLGEEVVDLLMGHGIVHGYADLYRLSVDQVANLNWLKERKGKDGQKIVVQVGQRNAQKLIQGIDASRTRGLARVLSSLSIRHVGPRVAQLIAKQYPTVHQLLAASREDLADIHEIGSAIAASVDEFCHSEYGQKILDELADVGVELSEPQQESDESDTVLKGKSVVVTGTMQYYKRDEIKALIEKLGGRVSSSVSKNTDFVVAGEKAGSKLTKASELGIKVLTEDEFRALVES
jgi:DNA ligase (NAD+)